MTWEPLKLDQSWDTRWDAQEAEDAVLRADDQALQALANLDRAIESVKQASEQYTAAMQWSSAARSFAAKFSPEIPDHTKGASK